MKDYKKILEGVVDIINTTEKSDIGFANICAYIGENCPELKESEDERIRKHLIKHFGNKSKTDWNGMPVDKIIAWLEKQGENNKWKPSKDEMDALYGLAYITNKMDDKKDEAITKLYQDLKREFFSGVSYENMFPLSPVDAPIKLKKQSEQNLANSAKTCKDEQKPADKVEQKFKAGDWVICGQYGAPCQIESIKGGRYYFTNGIGIPVESVNIDYHLWTIQDAKDGNVLYNKDGFAGNSVFIYKGIFDKTHACLYYTRLFKDKDFSIYNDVMWENGVGVSGGEFYPATKEQRDLLFKKMHEAGYEWDAEKKELKKIEQKSAWSEYDEEFLLELSQCCDLNKTQVQWLLSLKDRVQPQPKQEWSEEDERIKDAIYDYIYSDTHILYVDSQAPKGWLNSLKDRIQQKYEWSEEDEKMVGRIENAFSGTHHNYYYKDSREMTDWLKSLKERYTWKPSDEQIDALEDAIADAVSSIQKNMLNSLNSNLKKLREE